MNSVNELKENGTALSKDLITAKLQVEEIQTNGLTLFDDSDIQFNNYTVKLKSTTKSINEKLTENLTQTELLKTELESVTK